MQSSHFPLALGIALTLTGHALHAQPAKPAPAASTVLAASAARPASAASASATPSSAPVFVAPQAKPMGDKPYLDTLEGTNTFDAQRKLWPDKRPPLPPPPPPPPPPPIAEKDLQLYGVVIVGSLKRATVKVSSRFANLDAAGRGFISISEGQMLGDWQLKEIQSTHLVLSPTNGSPTTQMVVFTKKTDRVATPASVPAPMPTPMPTALAPGNDGTPQQATAAPAGNPNPNSVATTAGIAGAAPTTPVPATLPQSGNNASNTPINSLAAAIAAAQAHAQSNPQSQANATAVNPFLQLLKKQ